MKALLRWLLWQRRRWMLASAQEFRSGLERTITRERERAKHLVEVAELEESRAHIAYLETRAHRRISSRQSTQGAKP